MNKLIISLSLIFVFALSLVFSSCETQNNDPIATSISQSPIGAAKPTAVAAPNLQIITVPTQDKNGDWISIFTFQMTGDYLFWTQNTANIGDADWNSGDPTLFPERYTGTNHQLIGFVKGQILDKTNTVVAEANPVLYDVGDTMPLDSLYPSTSFPSFVGYNISPHWYNATTDNGVSLADGTRAGQIFFPAPLPAGDYKLLVTLDPNNWWGQYKEYSLDFTISGTTAGFRSMTIKGDGNLHLKPKYRR